MYDDVKKGEKLKEKKPIKSKIIKTHQKQNYKLLEIIQKKKHIKSKIINY